MLEVLLPKEGSPKGFCDVMGVDELKAELKDGIIDAVNNPKQAELDFKEYGKKIPTGVLLYGPPGCGKTYIIVVGATNRFDLINPAIQRRFEVKKFVGAPVKKQVIEQVKNNLSSKEKAKKLLENEDMLDKISDLLTGYSYHSINIISNNASLNALKRNRADIGYEDFEKAIKETNEEKVKEEDYKTHKKTTLGFIQ